MGFEPQSAGLVALMSLTTGCYLQWDKSICVLSILPVLGAPSLPDRPTCPLGSPDGTLAGVQQPEGSSSGRTLQWGKDGCPLRWVCAKP